jgi:chromate reductase
MATAPILVVSGTHRPDSNALKIARIVLGLYHAQDTPAELLSLTELPPEAFLPSVYAHKPPAVVAIQERVLAAAGLHVVTPEYNGSFPGVLKHFIDLLKFPESFERKPVAFVGEAAGIWGGLRAVEQLQAIFGYRNAVCLPERVFIPEVHKKLNPAGGLDDAGLVARLGKQAQAFCEFVARLRR